jgi:hypothetical protein
MRTLTRFAHVYRIANSMSQGSRNGRLISNRNDDYLFVFETLRLLAFYVEFVVVRLWNGRPAGIDRGNPGERGARLEECQEALEGALWAFGRDFNLSVWQILYPAGELKKLRLAIGPVAISNPLNAAFYSNVNVMNHSDFLQPLQAYTKRGNVLSAF